MLAVAVKDIKTLSYPVYVSPKLDGIRCLKVNGQAVSRKFKPIPNKFIREWIEANLPDGVDGELLAGGSFNEAQSLIMSRDGEPDFTYQLFDYVKGECAMRFNERQYHLLQIYNALSAESQKHVLIVPQYMVERVEELISFEERFIAAGYEGLMVRSIDSPYKNGRSTLREGYLLKVKRFEDSEAEIIGYGEQMHNGNEAEKDAFGRTKRSSCQENLVPAGILGKLLLKDIKTGVEFGCGTGFDIAMRKEIWDNQKKYLSRIVCYKCQPSGAKDLPRFPVFKGFRHPDDIGE